MIQKYAILNASGSLLNVIKADENFDPGEGKTKVLFDPTVHIVAKPPKVVRVSHNRFFFELHDFYESERLINAIERDIPALTDAELATNTGDPYKEGVKILRRFNHYMNRIEAIELNHPLTAVVLATFKVMGIYSGTEAEQDARIAEVLANTAVASLTSV